MFEEYANHEVAVYGGYLNDHTKLLQSASGGIATAMSEYMIEQGGWVAGVAYRDDFYGAEYLLTKLSSDLNRLKGSKYIECDKKSIYADVKNLISSGERVLFFGLPCTVAALYKFIGERPENLLTCELICHGPTSSQVHRDYVTHLENKYKSKVIDFSVRRKKGAWMPGYLYAKFENGEIFEKPFYETEYGYGFSIFGKESCYHCQFKGNNRQADIMIGDFWGATESDEYWNKNGVSVMFAETKKGDAFLNQIPNITLFSTTFEKAVKNNQMVIKSKAKKPNRDKFAKLLSKKDLIYAVKHSSSPKMRIKKFISNAIPQKIKSKIKNTFRAHK